jgi:hypothetical protein
VSEHGLVRTFPETLKEAGGRIRLNRHSERNLSELYTARISPNGRYVRAP